MSRHAAPTTITSMALKPGACGSAASRTEAIGWRISSGVSVSSNMTFPPFRCSGPFAGIVAGEEVGVDQRPRRNLPTIALRLEFWLAPEPAPDGDVGVAVGAPSVHYRHARVEFVDVED